MNASRYVQVYPGKILIHWHRDGSDFFQCGKDGPDVLFTKYMPDVSCPACRRSMQRTKEYRRESPHHRRQR